MIFCHVDCFCLQEEMKDEGEVFCDPYTKSESEFGISLVDKFI